MCPLFLFFVLADFIPLNFLWSAIIFGLASLTDALDGSIARKYNLITDFGKFIDPIADKIIVFAALGAFVYLDPCKFGVGMVWILLIVITRELLVTSFRTIAMSKNLVIAADGYGKVKTVTQMLAVLFILVECEVNLYPYPYIGAVLLAVSTALCVISGANYIIKNRQVFK